MAKAFLSKYLHSILDHSNIRVISDLSAGQYMIAPTGQFDTVSATYVNINNDNMTLAALGAGELDFQLSGVSYGYLLCDATWMELGANNGQRLVLYGGEGGKITLTGSSAVVDDTLVADIGSFTDLSATTGKFVTVSATNYIGVSTTPSGWASYPAIADVDLSGYILSGALSISGTEVSGLSGYFSTVSATNYIGVSTTPSAWAAYEATQQVSALSVGIAMTSAWDITKDDEDSIVFTYNG